MSYNTINYCYFNIFSLNSSLGKNGDISSNVAEIIVPSSNFLDDNFGVKLYSVSVIISHKIAPS